MATSTNLNRARAELIIKNLRANLERVDNLAKSVIVQIADEAKESSEDPTKSVDISTSENLMRTLKKADSFIYDPKVAEVCGDAEQAETIEIAIEELRWNIREMFQQEIVDKYPNATIETENPSRGSTSGVKIRTVGNFFSDFVKRNFDNSRYSYEVRQLNLLKNGMTYVFLPSKKKKDFRSFKQVFGSMANVISDKSNTDLIFNKMAEYTPDRIQAIIDAIKPEVEDGKEKEKFSETQIAAAYTAIKAYDDAFTEAMNDSGGNSQSKKQVLKDIIDGNGEVDKDVAPELIDFVRFLSLQTAYAQTLADSSEDETFKEFLLDTIRDDTYCDNASMRIKLTSILNEMQRWPNRADRLEGQRSRALYARANGISCLKEDISLLLPRFDETINQFEEHSDYPGMVDEMYSFLEEKCLNRYKLKEFDEEIRRMEDLRSIYREAEAKAKKARADGKPAKSGAKVISELVEAQEQIVKREKALIDRKEKYLKEKERVDNSGIARSNDDLDLAALGDTIGVKLNGHFKQANIAEFSYQNPDARSKTLQDILNSLSEEDYKVLRARAIADLEKKDGSKALMTKGGLIRKLGAFVVNKVGRFFRIRNIPTQIERNINEQIRTNLKVMINNNQEIQAGYNFVENEIEPIKREEIRLKEEHRARIIERDKQSKDLDKKRWAQKQQKQSGAKKKQDGQVLE